MNNFKILFTLFLLISTELYATNGIVNYRDAEANINKVMDLVLLFVKALGVGAIIWGVVEVLIEKDQNGQNGKKLAGFLKMIGGILLILIGSFIAWVSGDKNAIKGSSYVSNEINTTYIS